MKKRKICVVITARPSYARIRSALHALKARPDVELQLVVTAWALLERYGNVADIIEQEGFVVTRRVHSQLADDTVLAAAKATAYGLSALADTFHELQPDVVVSIADRYETMSTAVAAAFSNFPLAHIQGGEVTGSIDEKVRHAITKLSDLHFVSGEGARVRVERMGERSNTIYTTGCPSIDVAREAIEQVGESFDLFERFGSHGKPIDLTPGYIVVMQHPVTTEHGDAWKNIEQTLRAVDRAKLPTLWFWPNVDAGSDATSQGIRNYRSAHELSHVHFMKNMPPDDFIRLLHASRGIVGNSSVAIRECAWLGLPAVNIGGRQAGRDRAANVRDVGYDADEIHEAIMTMIKTDRLAPDMLYGDGYAGERIARILASAPLTIEKRLIY